MPIKSQKESATLKPEEREADHAPDPYVGDIEDGERIKGPVAHATEKLTGDLEYPKLKITQQCRPDIAAHAQKKAKSAATGDTDL